ncbi:unnamed protein product [Diamesa serratosioi]
MTTEPLLEYPLIFDQVIETPSNLPLNPNIDQRQRNEKYDDGISLVNRENQFNEDTLVRKPLAYTSNQNHRTTTATTTTAKKKSYDDPHKWHPLAHEKRHKPFMENDNRNVQNDLLKNYGSIMNDAASDEYQMNVKDDEQKYYEEYDENMIDVNENMDYYEYILPNDKGNLDSNESYQPEASNIENHEHEKFPNKWNLNNVVDNLVQNNNLTTIDESNLFHVLDLNEQLDKVLHENESKTFIPHVFTTEWRNGFVKPRLKRKMSEDGIQVSNGTNGNDVENKNVYALMGNQKYTNGTKKISIENDVANRKQQNKLNDSVAKFSVYKLSESTPRYNIQIKLFQKKMKKWELLDNGIVFSNSFNNYTSGKLTINSEVRPNVDSDGRLNVERIKLLIPQNKTNFHDDTVDIFMAIDQTTTQLRETFCPGQKQRSLVKRSIKSLQSFELMPKDGIALRDCTTKQKHLCLVLKYDKPPTLKLTIQFPYEKNEVFDKQSNNVKISSIFTDTSGDDLHLHAQFTIMSTNPYTNNYKLVLDGCDLLAQSNVMHPIRLPPNKAIQVDMNITLQMFTVRKQQTCHAKIVNVKNGATVVKRKFFIKPRSRCLCIWLCFCLCFDSVLTTEAADLCHSFKTKNEYLAGLLDDNDYDVETSCESDDNINLWKLLYIIPLMILMVVLLLGKCHQFLINCIFFLLLPFVWCCRCFLPKNKDFNRSCTSINGRTIVQEEFFTDSNTSNGDTDENLNLLAKSYTSFRTTPLYSHYRTTDDTSETIFDICHSHNNSQTKQHLIDDEDLRIDTNFVLNAMNHSQESLRKLDSHFSEANLNNDPRFDEAAMLVKQLLTARVVYRKFNQKLGFVQLRDNQSYSIRGYFIPAQNTQYQFITYSPVKQFWEISETATLVALVPHIFLDTKAFRRTYRNKIDVLEANDLIIYPKTTFPCINVQVQDGSMYNLN